MGQSHSVRSSKSTNATAASNDKTTASGGAVPAKQDRHALPSIPSATISPGRNNNVDNKSHANNKTATLTNGLTPKSVAVASNYATDHVGGDAASAKLQTKTTSWPNLNVTEFLDAIDDDVAHANHSGGGDEQQKTSDGIVQDIIMDDADERTSSPQQQTSTISKTETKPKSRLGGFLPALGLKKSKPTIHQESSSSRKETMTLPAVTRSLPAASGDAVPNGHSSKQFEMDFDSDSADEAETAVKCTSKPPSSSSNPPKPCCDSSNKLLPKPASATCINSKLHTDSNSVKSGECECSCHLHHSHSLQTVATHAPVQQQLQPRSPLAIGSGLNGWNPVGAANTSDVPPPSSSSTVQSSASQKEKLEKRRRAVFEIMTTMQRVLLMRPTQSFQV